MKKFQNYLKIEATHSKKFIGVVLFKIFILLRCVQKALLILLFQ